jgi:hypothetical protein
MPGKLFARIFTVTLHAPTAWHDDATTRLNTGAIPRLSHGHPARLSHPLVTYREQRKRKQQPKCAATVLTRGLLTRRAAGPSLGETAIRNHKQPTIPRAACDSGSLSRPPARSAASAAPDVRCQLVKLLSRRRVVASSCVAVGACSVTIVQRRYFRTAPGFTRGRPECTGSSSAPRGARRLARRCRAVATLKPAHLRRL